MLSVSPPGQHTGGKVVFAAEFAGDTDTALERWNRVSPDIGDHPYWRMVEAAMTAFADDAETARRDPDRAGRQHLPPVGGGPCESFVDFPGDVAPRRLSVRK